jgi:hypothetical protein
MPTNSTGAACAAEGDIATAVVQLFAVQRQLVSGPQAYQADAESPEVDEGQDAEPEHQLL